MIYAQICATCIGARARLTRSLERERTAAVLSELHAARLERRKERPHRAARFIEQAIELRYAAVKHQRRAQRAFRDLLTVPPTEKCPACCGRGTIIGNGGAIRGIPTQVIA